MEIAEADSPYSWPQRGSFTFDEDLAAESPGIDHEFTDNDLFVASSAAASAAVSKWPGASLETGVYMAHAPGLPVANESVPFPALGSSPMNSSLSASGAFNGSGGSSSGNPPFNPMISPGGPSMLGVAARSRFPTRARRFSDASSNSAHSPYGHALVARANSMNNGLGKPSLNGGNASSSQTVHSPQNSSIQSQSGLSQVTRSPTSPTQAKKGLQDLSPPDKKMPYSKVRRGSLSSRRSNSPSNEQAAADVLANKRLSHNAIERKRRDTISDRIKELSTLVPQTFSGDGLAELTNAEKAHKSNVLKRAYDYVLHLEQELLLTKESYKQLQTKLMVYEPQPYQQGPPSSQQRQQQQASGSGNDTNGYGMQAGSAIDQAQKPKQAFQAQQVPLQMRYQQQQQPQQQQQQQQQQHYGQMPYQSNGGQQSAGANNSNDNRGFCMGESIAVKQEEAFDSLPSNYSQGSTNHQQSQGPQPDQQIYDEDSGGYNDPMMTSSFKNDLWAQLADGNTIDF